MWNKAPEQRDRQGERQVQLGTTSVLALQAGATFGVRTILGLLKAIPGYLYNWDSTLDYRCSRQRVCHPATMRLVTVLAGHEQDSPGHTTITTTTCVEL